MTVKTRDNTWYVAIEKGITGYSSFIGAGGESYRTFRELSEEGNYGIEIVAEEFGASDEGINRITGFDKQGKPTGNLPLKNLIDRLNFGEEFDIQEELTRLCKEE